MNFIQYRPASDTSAAVAAALIVATRDVQGSEQRVTEAKRVRDEALLTAAPRELKAAEDELSAARGDAERLAAIIEQLSTRRLQRIEQEAVDRVGEAVGQRLEATAAFSAFVDQHGGQLADLLKRGATLHQDVASAGFNVRQAQVHVFDRHPDRADEVATPNGGNPLTNEAEIASRFFEAIAGSFVANMLDQLGTVEANDGAAPVAPAPGKRGPIAAARRMIGAEG